VNNFLNAIQRRDSTASALFIKNSKALAEGDSVGLARELTDLRMQLQETRHKLKGVKKEFENHKKSSKEAKFFDFFLFGLSFGTLILLGISYLFI
jgi:uncharacterized membrane protein